MLKSIILVSIIFLSFSTSMESYAQEPGEAICREQLQLNKNDKDALDCIIKIYVKNQKFDDLIVFLKERSELVPDDANNHFKLALLYEFKNENDKAIAQYSEVIKLKPDHARSLLGIGRCYLKTGKTTEARKALEAAIKIDPNLEEARMLLLNAFTEEAAIPNTVQGRRNEQIKRVISGKRVKPGEEEWQKICSLYPESVFATI